MHASVRLPEAPSADAKDSRGKSKRVSTITDSHSLRARSSVFSVYAGDSPDLGNAVNVFL
jgi:hypothetical protein